LSRRHSARAARALIALAAAQKPDVIAATGDILDNFSDLKESGLSDFYAALLDICPVFAVTGNHELRTEGPAFWRRALGDMGVQVLDNRFTRLRRGNSALVLMGLAGNTPYLPGFFQDIDKSLPKILLSHRPEFWEPASCWAHSPALTLSGHAHGGQVRLPGGFGLFAPGQGLFPKYTSGLYAGGGRMLLVSRGIIQGRFPPRINNKPHLPVIRLRCGETIPYS